MEPSRRPTVQVVVNGHGGAANGTAARPRPLTVDEALQYSPLTTSTSFGLNCISVPDIGRAAPRSHLLSAEQRRDVSKTIQDLQHRSKGKVNHLKLASEALTKFLDADSLSEFKFKTPIKCPVPNSSQRLTDSNRSLSPPRLSDLAKMVLESTNVAYRYPTPITPSPKSKREKHTSLLTPSRSPSSPQKSRLHNQAAFAQNSTNTLQGSGPPDANSQPIVLIPGLPTSSQRSDYEVLPDAPKRRKLDRPTEDETRAIHVRAQREEANAALQKFQDLLLEVFETEDQLQPDTSANLRNETNDMFEMVDLSDGSGFVLNSKVHTRLQNPMRKLVGYERLGDIPTEYIKRLQKLCEGPIVAAQTIDLKIEGAWSEDDYDAWLQRVQRAENGASAAATLLWTMIGNNQEKELCPEDILQCVPNLLTNVFENCVIPTVESRPNGKDAEIFSVVSRSKEFLVRLVHQTRKVLDLLSTMCSQITIAEGTINTAEFLAAKLIFVENAHNEKESALGFQSYEGTRRAGMDLLARIFASYNEQREFILDEILTSLEKLPSTKQSARQFKLSDNKNIQLLSALFVQLVQTTSLRSSESKDRKYRRVQINGNAPDVDMEADEDAVRDGPDHRSNESLPALGRLVQRTDALYENAARSAKYIINYFVGRAMKSTKSGDEPYRNLLDLFVEDLLTILNSTDWPACELLLRILAFQMINIADNDKSAATAKNMALELLGKMGSAISTLKVSAQNLATIQDETESEAMGYLRQLMDEQSRGSLSLEDLVAADGPYRMTLEYLQERNINNNLQLSSARGYYLVHWAKSVCSCFVQDEEDFTDIDPVVDELASLLLKMLLNPRWLETESDFPSISTAQGRLAYLLTVLSTGFCKAFDAIVKVLLSSISSDQAKVRSRSLKSVVQMLETDPSLLDRDPTVLRVIMRCAGDGSPLVRDSALSLIGKCLTLKPTLVQDGYRVILRCSADPTVGVRKRCIALLKEIYASALTLEMKIDIAEAFLQRLGDVEESVAIPARQTLEEIWLQPYYRFTDSGGESAKGKVALGEQVALMVQLIQRNESIPSVVEKFLKSSFSQTTKTAPSNFKVCRALVTLMFEDLVDDSLRPEKPGQGSLLKAITVFAKANARLFAPEQLQTLQPYIANLAKDDDLLLFRSVVVIYRCVLPYVSTPHSALLQLVQSDLFRSVSKLSKVELDEVMGCLWTIDGVLRNTERLVKLLASVLRGIVPYKDWTLTETDSDGAPSKDLSRVRGYVRIAGSVGKNCDLDTHSKLFKDTFAFWKGGSVAGLIADLLVPFTSSKQPISLQTMALESLGSVCQSWPAQFSKEQVRRVITSVFGEGDTELQHIVLKTFVDFFGIREHAAESFATTEVSATQEPTGRLGISLRPSEHDNAAALIAQEFLKPMLRLAASSVDAKALSAIQVIASINRQGLVHPKECAGTLVALETSTNNAIASIAFETHKMVHQQHETMFEREYMRATHEAFIYQRDVIGDPSGATFRPFKSKLASLFEIIKISSSKYVKKFLSNLISKVNFEPSKLDVSGEPPHHLLYARFLAENLAFFEYGRTDELLHAVSHMEAVVGKTGADIANAIDIEVFHTRVTAEDPFVEGAIQADRPELSIESVEPRRLRHLTVAAMILSILWEARTHLRRQYNLNASVKTREPKGKDNKDLAKPPTKSHSVNGDRFWEALMKNMESLESLETMMARCQAFVNLMNIDDEVKVAAEEDDMRESMSTSADPEDKGMTPMTGGKGPRGGKRKSSVSVGGTPKKPRGRPSLNGRRQSSKNLDEDGDWD